MTNKINQMKFTTASDTQSYSKIDIYQSLEDALSNILVSKHYSSDIRLGVVFQCFPKNNTIHKGKSFKKMRRKTKTLELYLALDYERVMQGTDEENLSHIKDVFLKGCETFLKPMKGFKWNEFYEEVQKQMKS